MKSLRIVVAPLDWGLGHAGRCVPIIKYLDQQGHTVEIISGKANYDFLKREFPKLSHSLIPSFSIHLPKTKVARSLVLQSSKIAKGIRDEEKIFSDWLQIHPTDLIISDNRYGIYSKEIPSVIISHQLKPKVPFGWNKFPQKKIDSYLDRFAEIWIPDDQKWNISGELTSYSKRKNLRYLGLLTRFQPSSHTIEEYDIIGLVSGPETQRTVFQKELHQWMKSTDKKCLLLCGLPKEEFDYQEENVRVVSHLETKELEDLILKSRTVISRSGYSTIMDLLTLKKQAILVPTPGQSEQEYLAKFLMENEVFMSIKQGEIAESIDLQSMFDISHIDLDKNLYQREIDLFLEEKFPDHGRV